MLEDFNDSSLEKYNIDEVLLLQENDNIIVYRNYEYKQYLNAVILNKNNNQFHVRYYNNSNDFYNNNISGINETIYNIKDYNWIPKYFFKKNGTDDIIKLDTNKSLCFYKP